MGYIKIKIRRGTQLEVEKYTTPLNEGEPVWMTDNHRVLICDGSSSIRDDLLEDDVTTVGLGKCYGKDTSNVGFQDYDYSVVLKPEHFYIPDDSDAVLGDAFSLINSVNYSVACTDIDTAYAVFSPSIFDRLNSDTSFKLGYTLTGDSTVGHEVNLNCYVWQLKRGDVPNATNASFEYTETITASADNIDKFSEFSFSNARSEFVGTDATSQTEIVVVGLSRDGATDSYTGTFSLIDLPVYYSNSATEYGYNMGGYTSVSAISTIDRIKFPFNTGNAVNNNNLSVAMKQQSACNSSTHGFIMGGTDVSDVLYSTIDKFEFPFNSGSASNIGNLSSDYRSSTGFNSSQFGYNVGGVSDVSDTKTSDVNRLVLSYDGADTIDVGNLTATTYQQAACNSSVYGFIFAGISGSSTDRITFPFDSGTATAKGNVSVNSLNSGSFNSSSHGYCIGGGDGTKISTVYRITFPFDSGDASNVADVSVAKQSRGCNSTIHGYIMGGESTTEVSTIESFLFSVGSSSTVEGNLSDAITQGASIDGVDFVTMLI